MPFTMSHKASKGKSRQNTPSPLDLSPSSSTHANSSIQFSPLPTPPSSSDTGTFKFWSKKKSQPAPTPLPYYPAETPRPILKKNGDSASPTSIKFAHDPQASSPPPFSRNSSAGSVISSGVSTPPQIIISPSPTEPGISTGAPSPNGTGRRSSRPTSPSATSFGARTRTSQCSVSSTSTIQPAFASPRSSLSERRTSTPPVATVSTFTEQAHPLSSPYRPTSERPKGSMSYPRRLPVATTQDDIANRPPRTSSLFPRTDSLDTIRDQSVPMLNVIPATPQDTSEGFTGAWVAPPKRKAGQPSALEEAVNIEEMDEIPLEPPVMPAAAAETRVNPSSGFSIDFDFDFTPFAPLADLPELPSLDSSGSIGSVHSTARSIPPEMSLPPSPPCESYSSLPSLESQASIESSSSETSMPTSASSSSLDSIPDVEEALGSMLASLSDNSLDISKMSMREASTPTKEIDLSSFKYGGNPGLGLGLDLPSTVTMMSTMSDPKPISKTAPLSPRRKKAIPPPLDIGRAKAMPSNDSSQGINSAPPCINHRVAFYRTAKAAPNSPTSGIFTLDLGHSPMSSMDLSNWMRDYKDTQAGQGVEDGGGRDSISLKSEVSDDDLHTASIIALTPVLGDRARMIGMREEVMLSGEAEVGLAL